MYPDVCIVGREIVAVEWLINRRVRRARPSLLTYSARVLSAFVCADTVAIAVGRRCFGLLRQHLLEYGIICEDVSNTALPLHQCPSRHVTYLNFPFHKKLIKRLGGATKELKRMDHLPAAQSAALLRLNSFFLIRSNASLRFLFSSTSPSLIASNSAVSTWPLRSQPSRRARTSALSCSKKEDDAAFFFSRRHCCEMRFCLRLRSEAAASSAADCVFFERMANSKWRSAGGGGGETNACRGVRRVCAWWRSKRVAADELERRQGVREREARVSFIRKCGGCAHK